MNQEEARMNLLEAIHHRRSIRSYAPQKLDAAAIQKLLDAAVWAPTAVHEEPWVFVIMQDKAVLKSLSDGAKKIFMAEAERAHPEQARRLIDRVADPEFNIFYDAGTLIVICARPKGAFVTADCWLAAQNLLLAAHGMGLGSCVIGFAVPALNTAEIKAELGIPPDCSAVAPIIVGVPRGEPRQSSRRAPDIVQWI